jgi:ribosome production factor 1
MSTRTGISAIKNKEKRKQVLAKERQAKSTARKRARSAEASAAADGGAPPPPKKQPRTLETMRAADSTIVAPGDEEVAADEAVDEFAPIFSGALDPKVLVTTQINPSAAAYPLLGALLGLVPRAFYYRRHRFTLRDIGDWALAKGFTHLVVLMEAAKGRFSLVVSRLGPAGPTGCFRFSSPVLPAGIANHGTTTEHAPEILLNNFTTRLGRRIGRLLGSLFPHRPDFVGRQVVTMHNQRDYVFFRRHRYIFRDGGRGADLQELGPRFTLKPRWLLAGNFNPGEGEYEYLHRKSQRDLTKKTFML